MIVLMRKVLGEWYGFLHAESHILREHPDLLFQQAANQPAGAAPAAAALERYQAGLERRLWLRWLNKPRQRSDRTTMACRGDKGSLRFSRDGNRLLWFSAAGTPLQQWDIRTGAELVVSKDETGVGPEPFWLEDAPKFQGHALKLTDADRARLAESRSCSADGRRVIENCGGELVLRDTQSGGVVARTSEAEGEIGKCVFSSDGTRFAYANHVDLVVRESQRGWILAWLHGPSDNILTFAFSPDGQQLAAVYGDAYSGLDERASSTLVVWEIDAIKNQPLELQGHLKTLTDYAFSPAGTHVVTGSADDSVILWDARTGEKVRTLGYRTTDNLYSVLSCFFAADGRLVISHDAGGWVNAWANEGGDSLWRRRGDFCVLSPDGMWLVLWDSSAPDEIRIHSVDNGEVEGTIGPLDLSAVVKNLVISPDRAHLACLSGGLLRIYVWSTKAERASFGEPADPIRTFSFSPDGTLLVSIAEHTAPIIWDVGTATRVATLEELEADAVRCRFSNDGLWIAFECRATYTDTRCLRVYDTVTGVFRATLPLADDWVFAPRGDTLVTSVLALSDADIAASPRQVKLWRGQDGAELLTYEGRADRIDSLALSPDGARLAARVGRRGLVVWDVESGKRLCRYQSREVLTWPEWSPDGGRLLLGGDEGTAYLLKLEGTAAGRG